MEVTTKSKLINILKGVGVAIAFTLIGLLIFSAILTYTNLGEEWIQPVIIVLTGISILIGSSLGCIKLKKNGIALGATISVMYFILLYVISSIITMNFNISSQMLIIIAVGGAFGIIGGIIGINKS